MSKIESRGLARDPMTGQFMSASRDVVPRGDGRRVQICIRVAPDVYQALRAEAEASKCGLGGAVDIMVRMLIAGDSAAAADEIIRATPVLEEDDEA